MKEIGKLLKERREKKKLSLAQAHAATKIQEKYLTALEEGNSKVFSAPVYYKSFLRSYAKYLKLDPELLIKQYEEINSSSDALERYDYENAGDFFIKESYEDKPAAAGGGQEEEFKIGKIETKHIVAALVLVAVLLGVFFYLNSKISEPVSEISSGDKTKIQMQADIDTQTAEQVQTEIQPEVKQPEVKPEAKKQGMSADKIAEPVKKEPAGTGTAKAISPATAPSATVSPAAAPSVMVQSATVPSAHESLKTEAVRTEAVKTETVKTETVKTETPERQALKREGTVSVPRFSSLLDLRIEAVENVWVKIDSDGREQFQGTLLKDNSKSFKADSNFSLKIGYTPGIKVFFNNEQIDVISGSVQDVNTIFLKRE